MAAFAAAIATSGGLERTRSDRWVAKTNTTIFCTHRVIGFASRGRITWRRERIFPHTSHVTRH
jgi:hypothetical protein